MKKHIFISVLFMTSMFVIANVSSMQNSEYINNGYIVHPDFVVLFTDPMYTCYGYKAVSNSQTHTCNKLGCGQTFYSQKFIDSEGRFWTMYSNSRCSHSKTGFHNELQLNEIYVCDCKIQIAR